jgi:hypothetical protein
LCSDYITKLTWYRQPIWTCKATNKAGLTYEQALASESKAKSLAGQARKCQ